VDGRRLGDRELIDRRAIRTARAVQGRSRDVYGSGGSCFVDVLGGGSGSPPGGCEQLRVVRAEALGQHTLERRLHAPELRGVLDMERAARVFAGRPLEQHQRLVVGEGDGERVMVRSGSVESAQADAPIGTCGGEGRPRPPVRLRGVIAERVAKHRRWRFAGGMAACMAHPGLLVTIM
jgi:hypothetical protein